jgi:uroporphyrinogen-III synthase
VAKEFLGSALAQEMSAALSGRRILLPRSQRAGRGLPDSLAAAGATITEVVAYHTGGLGRVEPGVLDAVREGNVDVVSFFSPSAVENLRGELGAATLSRLSERAALAAVGPVTATALRDAGLPVAILAAEATGESMATAIVGYFSEANFSEARSS